MLVQFSVKNYKTFAAEAKISFVASKYYMERAEDNLVHFQQFDLSLLKSAVIYGANASGKSKLFESMAFVKNFILTSSKDKQLNEAIEVEPFRLNTETEIEPSVFEIIFIHHNEMYRYGFEATKEKILTEWLYFRPKTKEIELFFREEQQFEVHETKFKVKDLISHDRIRPNALMLSVAASWNEKMANTVLSWIENNFNVMSGLQEKNYHQYSMSKLKDRDRKNEILAFLRQGDLGIDELSPKMLELDSFPKELREIILKEMKESQAEWAADVFTSHKKFDKNKEEVGAVKFLLDEDESSGTKKYFALSAPILETLKQGALLVIDELDAKLHPNLTHKIIELFNCKTKNPNNAQLLFNTHDTNLLESNLFRRDQIWFIEKDRYGAATLYALSDFKGIRKDDALEKNYIAGRYGAVPFLGDFELMK